MTRRPACSPRGPVWLFALLLLLRMAMPFLASASADLRGVALSEVCSVHGVSLASREGEGRDPLSGAAGDVAGHHCALGALGALVAACPAPGSEGIVPTVVFATRVPAVSSVPWPDAAAGWVARHHHGPPGPA